MIPSQNAKQLKGLYLFIIIHILGKELRQLKNLESMTIFPLLRLRKSKPFQLIGDASRYPPITLVICL